MMSILFVPEMKDGDIFEIWRLMSCLGLGCILCEFLSGRIIFLALGLSCFICGGLSLIVTDKLVLGISGGCIFLLGYILFKKIEKKK